MKHKGVKYWKEKAWKEFSLYIRSRDNTQLGCRCFTCGKYYDLKKMQAGHFQPGRFGVFLFDERQVNSQCYACNVGLHGNWPSYLKEMVKLYGQNEVDKMLNERTQVRQWKNFELEEIYLKYKALNNKGEFNSAETRGY